MYDRSNIFAKILRGEIPCNKVYEDDAVLAFRDLYPAAPVHVLVLPKDEYVSFDDFTARAGEEEIGRFFQTVRKIAAQEGVSETGYRLITNHKELAGQSVFHFHVHIVGGRTLGALLEK